MARSNLGGALVTIVLLGIGIYIFMVFINGGGLNGIMNLLKRSLPTQQQQTSATTPTTTTAPAPGPITPAPKKKSSKDDDDDDDDDDDNENVPFYQVGSGPRVDPGSKQACEAFKDSSPAFYEACINSRLARVMTARLSIA